ncbi:hypothetical protein PAXRUDRAFT_257699 [Paxillus rubicundulus Ve08.2h10]|uniref:Uncharacterized protein n=1 Tax=Paxillus rubicundulus Ve08.2h10 TaxID=930991 RepID=A0A0D0CAS4_9AGAM|nr:hypothetical protein PAXRUDRAFT_257699 [Paxillus rubicundulus Ve08.2h10]
MLAGSSANGSGLVASPEVICIDNTKKLLAGVLSPGTWLFLESLRLTRPMGGLESAGQQQRYSNVTVSQMWLQTTSTELHNTASLEARYRVWTNLRPPRLTWMTVWTNQDDCRHSRRAR